jgi:hypothetical protein
MYLHARVAKACKRESVAWEKVETRLTRMLVPNEICRGNGGENERETRCAVGGRALAAVGDSTKEGLGTIKCSRAGV